MRQTIYFNNKKNAITYHKVARVPFLCEDQKVGKVNGGVSDNPVSFNGHR